MQYPVNISLSSTPKQSLEVPSARYSGLQMRNSKSMFAVDPLSQDSGGILSPIALPFPVQWFSSVFPCHKIRTNSLSDQISHRWMAGKKDAAPPPFHPPVQVQPFPS